MTVERKSIDVTAYQQKLIDQLLITPKVKDAAERIGMSYDYARKVVTKPHVIEALLESRQRVSEKAEIDSAWVLREQVEVFSRCMEDVPVLGKDGNPIGVYRFDSSGANRALELIGKHKAVNAFKETDERNIPIDTNWTVTIVDPKPVI